jgi:hypothetical protein
VRYQTTKQSDFDCDDVRSTKERRTLRQKAKNVLPNPRDCKHGNRDENVYYDDDGDVASLPLHRAIDMYGNSRWWLQGLSVSSIPPSTTLPLTINPSSQLQSISHSIPPRSTLPPPSIVKLTVSSRTPVTTATSLPTTRNSIAQTSERSDTLDISTERTVLFLSLRPIPHPATILRQSCR